MAKIYCHCTVIGYFTRGKIYFRNLSFQFMNNKLDGGFQIKKSNNK